MCSTASPGLTAFLDADATPAHAINTSHQEDSHWLPLLQANANGAYPLGLLGRGQSCCDNARLRNESQRSCKFAAFAGNFGRSCASG